MPEIKLGLVSSGYTMSERSYQIDLCMNAIDFSGIFFFKTTSLSDVNSIDTLFCTEPNNWPDISFSEGVVSQQINGKDIPSHLLDTSYNVKEFGPNWLAYNITNTMKKSDELFENHNDLVQQYVNLDNSMDPSGMKQLIQGKLSNAGSKSDPLSNANKTIQNITRDIILHFRNSDDPNIMFRLVEMMNNSEGGWTPIEFKPNDTLIFDIIYDARIFAWQNYQVDDQDYVVKITLN